MFALVKKIIHMESFGGIFLFFCALLAMVVANSPIASWYFDLWNQKLGLSYGDHFLGFSLHLWINDVLMSFFFLMVGLEIKREFLYGGLSGFKKAAFPAIAAVGGMIFPAIIYLIFNLGTPTEHGFGIPMATDIAFALGVILLLGKRVPSSLKLFLVTLAVVDDLGAIVVIAIFYSSGIASFWLLCSVFLVGILVALNYAGVRSLTPYLLIGIVLWFCIHESGIHATISAVILAFCIPIEPKIQTKIFMEKMNKELEHFSNKDKGRKNILLNHEQIHHIETMHKVMSEVQSPLSKLEHFLHSYSTYLIMPLFAFANAGVAINGGNIDPTASHIVYGIGLGLIVGKPLGILILTYLCEKFGIASRPSHLSWGCILGAGMLAGIGFTMSMFVTNLAFENAGHIDIAKISILCSSLLAGILGSLTLLFLCKKTNMLKSQA
ncbi:Na+/H+ antiporter NhaA [Helicobacter cholecystus]|uniref:Na+/H+ antiporter NhaA n=1 Tax=Helicobacter cholecystus TaxID=45498 RepID=UPI0027397DFF|nr:Na+/H+ antiporter NhaA [Helicobacter cholecystus]